MKTAVIYTSKHGTTEKVAKTIKREMESGDVTLFDLRKNKNVDIFYYDQVIIGGSIHAGGIPKRLKKFMEKNMDSLLEKPLGLFLCCMYEEEAQAQFEIAFPDPLKTHARSTKCVGGEFLFEKMNFIEKAMVKKIAGTETSVSRLDDQKINELINDMHQ